VGKYNNVIFTVIETSEFKNVLLFTLHMKIRKMSVESEYGNYKSFKKI
jgi:hypothetical protein